MCELPPFTPAGIAAALPPIDVGPKPMIRLVMFYRTFFARIADNASVAEASNETLPFPLNPFQ